MYSVEKIKRTYVTNVILLKSGAGWARLPRLGICDPSRSILHDHIANLLRSKNLNIATVSESEY